MDHRKKNFIIFILAMVLIYSLIFNYRTPSPHTLFDETPMRDTIAQRELVIAQQQEEIERLQADKDTITLTEYKIKTEYEFVYLFNETASVAQLDSVLRVNVGLSEKSPDSDSLIAYTSFELRLITDKVVRANECDTLLTLCKLSETKSDSIISSFETIVSAKDDQLEQYDLIVGGKNADIAALQEELFHQSKKNRRRVIALCTGVGALGTGLIYLILN